MVYLSCVVVYHSLYIIGFLHQIYIVRNKEARLQEWENFDTLLKDTYKKDKVENSLDYSAAFFKFLTVRTLLANLTFDFCFFYFYGPAYLWNYYLGKFNKWGWCSMDGDYDI